MADKRYHQLPLVTEAGAASADVVVTTSEQ